MVMGFCGHWGADDCDQALFKAPHTVSDAPIRHLKNAFISSIFRVHMSGVVFAQVPLKSLGTNSTKSAQNVTIIRVTSSGM